MTKKEKLQEKFFANPSSITGNQVYNICLDFGYTLVPNGSGTSHHKFVKEWCETIILPLHNGDCLPVYKKKIAKLLKNMKQ